MPDNHEEHLTLLERAQLLHDATLRRHGEMLDRHAEQLVLLRGIQERQERLMETLTLRGDAHEQRLEQTAHHLTLLTTLAAQHEERRHQHEEQMAQLRTIVAQHEERMARLQQTLDVIKDMLERGNGH